MNTPGMRQINAACKICRQPIVIEADIACPIEWVHKLTAMIVCDNCAAKVRRYCDDHPKPPKNARATHPDP